jgi:hypothetical protein
MAQERMCRYVDPDQKEAPTYQVGDLVVLSGRNIQIEKIVSPLAVRLIVPRKWKIHNIFHVSLLEPFRTSEYRPPLDPSRVLREADDVEQSEEYDVEEVMSSVEWGRRNNRRILNLIKWLDFPDRQDWIQEPFDKFSSCGLEKLRQFHQRNPDALHSYQLSDESESDKTGIHPIVYAASSRSPDRN